MSIAVKRPGAKDTSENSKPKKFKKNVDTKKKPFVKKSPNANAAPKPGEKTDWQKLKKEKKELKLKRKKSKAFYEVSVEVKQIYEKLKCRSTPNKKDLVTELFNILKKTNSITKVVMAHDTARIVQCLLKHASPEIRSEISEELLPIVSEMATSKYAHFCVLRMIKYGSHNIKEKLIEKLFGNIVKLATHTVSTNIIDVIYLTWATNKQKAFMRQEFYGDMYKKSKDNSVKKLSDTYESSPTMKTAILGALKINLTHAANKKLVDNSLIHAVLLEYLEECSEEDRNEIINLFSPMIPSLVTTQKGCKAAILCFWHSATKERRGIVKSLKEHLENICTHEHGHVLILAIVNTMDDTKAIKKSLFDPIYPQLESIVESQWGRKVLEWFVEPADKECFHPQLIAFLEEGLKYGKKDKETRRKEILEQIQEPLRSKIVENPKFWLKTGHIGLTTGIVLKHLDADNFSPAAESLAKIISQPDWTVNVKEEEEEKKKAKAEAEEIEKKISAEVKAPKVEEIETIAGIEHSGLHIALKKIIKHDKERSAAGLQTFGGFVANEVTSETIGVWIKLNRACFILLNIYENCSEDTVHEKLKSLLSEHLTQLKRQKHAGAKLLIEKLKLK